MAKKAGVEIPTTTMARVERAVYVSAQQMVEARASKDAGGESSARTTLAWVLGALIVVAVGIAAAMALRGKRHA
jgi:hypothetical protein